MSVETNPLTILKALRRHRMRAELAVMDAHEAIADLWGGAQPDQPALAALGRELAEQIDAVAHFEALIDKVEAVRHRVLNPIEAGDRYYFLENPEVALRLRPSAPDEIALRYGWEPGECDVTDILVLKLCWQDGRECGFKTAHMVAPFAASGYTEKKIIKKLEACEAQGLLPPLIAAVVLLALRNNRLRLLQSGEPWSIAECDLGLLVAWERERHAFEREFWTAEDWDAAWDAFDEGALS